MNLVYNFFRITEMYSRTLLHVHYNFRFSRMEFFRKILIRIHCWNFGFNRIYQDIRNIHLFLYTFKLYVNIVRSFSNGFQILQQI